MYTGISPAIGFRVFVVLYASITIQLTAIPLALALSLRKKSSEAEAFGFALLPLNSPPSTLNLRLSLARSTVAAVSIIGKGLIPVSSFLALGRCCFYLSNLARNQFRDPNVRGGWSIVRFPPLSPNIACTRQVGFVPFYGLGLGLVGKSELSIIICLVVVVTVSWLEHFPL